MGGHPLKPDREHWLVLLILARLGPLLQVTLRRLIVQCRLQFWFLKLYLVAWSGGLLDQTNHRQPARGLRFFPYWGHRASLRELPGGRRLNCPMPQCDRV